MKSYIFQNRKIHEEWHYLLTSWAAKHSIALMMTFENLFKTQVFLLFFQGEKVSHGKKKLVSPATHSRAFPSAPGSFQHAANMLSTDFPPHCTAVEGWACSGQDLIKIKWIISTASSIVFLMCNWLVFCTAKQSNDYYHSLVSLPWKLSRQQRFSHHGIWATSTNVNRVKRENTVLVLLWK